MTNEEFRANMIALTSALLQEVSAIRHELQSIGFESADASSVISLSRPPLPEATVMRSGETSYFRQPLHGNHFIIGKVINESICDLMVELPTGDRIPISESEAKRQFGDIRFPQAFEQSSHPTDRALNSEDK